VVVAALLVGAFLVFNNTVYYVGVSDGNVAVFHGMPMRVAGVELSGVVEVTSTRYESLEPYLQQRVDAHDLVGKEEGLRFARSLGSP